MPVDSPTLAAPSAPPASIAVDLLCLRCRYNLRSISEAAACPECGLAVADTLSVIARFPDRLWLRRLRLGLDLAIASQVAGIGLAVGGIVVAAVSASPPVIMFTAAAVALIPPALALAGAWLFATPEPGQPDLRERGVARRCATALVLLWLATLAAGLMMMPDDLFVFGSGLAILIGIVGVFTAGQWARHVALRLAAPTLAKATRAVSLGDAVIGCSALFGVTLLALLEYVIPPGDVLVRIILVAGALGLAATLLAFACFGLLTWILMVTFRVVVAETLAQMSRPAQQRGGA